jgi:hypothetical protein
MDKHFEMFNTVYAAAFSNIPPARAVSSGLHQPRTCTHLHFSEITATN